MMSRIADAVLAVMLTATPAAVVCAQTTAAHPPDASANPTARPDNYYAAGNRVVVSAPMPADVLVAGRDVEIREPVAGDIAAVGWRIALAGRAEDDVRLAGSDVSIDAPVQGDLTVAGGSVRLGPAVSVSGRTWITGGSVVVEGVLERDVAIAAAEVVIDGEVRQPIHVVAEKLEVRPGARLLGPVTYRGPSDAVISDQATVTGPFTFTRVEQREVRRARETPAVSTFLFTAHLFLAGVLVIAFLPRTEQSVVKTLRARPWVSLLAGFTLLVTVPIAAVVLMLTVLALPIGLMLAAAYAVALFVGLLTTAFFLGDAEARWLKPQEEASRGEQAVILLAGIFTLALLRMVFGGLAVLGAVLFGLGALSVWFYQAWVRARQASTAA